MIRIFQYRDKCIGCNACVEADRFRWRMSRRDGKSVLIKGVEKKGIYRVDVEDDEEEAIIKAVKNCPVNIIKYQKL